MPGLWNVKHQCDTIFKQHTPAQASLPAQATLLLLHKQPLLPHTCGIRPTRMLKPGHCRQAGQSVCAGALPAAPQSAPQHRVTKGGTGCAVAGTLLLGWCHKRMLPGAGGEVCGAVGAARHGAGGCRLASTLLLILQEGDLWIVESSCFGEGGGEDRVQARIWLVHLPSAGVTVGLGMPVCRPRANALCRRLVHCLQQQAHTSGGLR